MTILIMISLYTDNDISLSVLTNFIFWFQPSSSSVTLSPAYVFFLQFEKIGALVEMKDKSGNTALHYAAGKGRAQVSGHVHILMMIMIVMGYVVTYLSRRSSRFTVCVHSFFKEAELLVKYRPNLATKKNDRGDKPLHLAARFVGDARTTHDSWANQWTNRGTKQPDNQSIVLVASSVDQIVGRWIDHSFNLPFKQPIKQPAINRSINRVNDRSFNQSTNQSLNQSVDRSII